MTFLNRVNSVLVDRLLKHVSGRRQVERIALDSRNTQVEQRCLFLALREALSAGHRRPSPSEIAFRAWSQSDEDGILLLIFAAIGFTNRLCVDLGSALPEGSNTANLIFNWGFGGLLVDGDPTHVGAANRLFREHPDTWLSPPKVVHAWITRENVNELIESQGLNGEIDLLSIDLDGVDWWICREIRCVRPRAIVVEIQDIWGTVEAVTVPYSPDFRHDVDYDYCGASLMAWVKMLGERGYRLVATNRLGFNAFFVRQDLMTAALTELLPADCLKHQRNLAEGPIRLARSRGRRWESV
jgi:hypothetical protein